MTSSGARKAFLLVAEHTLHIDFSSRMVVQSLTASPGRLKRFAGLHFVSQSESE